MAYYIGLDVSQKQTWICVVDDKGKTVAEGCSLTRAADVYGWLGNRVERADIVKVSAGTEGMVIAAGRVMAAELLTEPPHIEPPIGDTALLY